MAEWIFQTNSLQGSGTKAETSWGSPVMEVLSHTGQEESTEVMARIISRYFHGQGWFKWANAPPNRKSRYLPVVLVLYPL